MIKSSGYMNNLTITQRIITILLKKPLAVVMISYLQTLSGLGFFPKSRSQIPVKSWIFFQNITCDYILLFLKLPRAQQLALLRCPLSPDYMPLTKGLFSK